MLVEGKVFPYKRKFEKLFETAGRILGEDFSKVNVSVNFVSEGEIKDLNNKFRQIDKVTDVLSFPMIEFDRESDFSHVGDCVEDCFNPETGELLLGDIVISVEKVAEQAEQYGHSQTRELAFLVAHSMLHLCGYDHLEDDEREVMEKRQRDILSGKGYSR